MHSVSAMSVTGCPWGACFLSVCISDVDVDVHHKHDFKNKKNYVQSVMLLTVTDIDLLSLRGT